MKENLFGTDGIRTLVGQYPLDQQSLVRFGNALGLWLTQRFGKQTTVLLGHDTRQSCSLIKAALKTGLLSHSITLYDGHVLPTPVISQLVQKTDRFACGIIVSASHNPYHDNGIKLVTRNGKLNLEDEALLSSLFHEYHDAAISYNNLGTDLLFLDAAQQYENHLSSYFDTNFLHKIRIVLDCAHGATYHIAPVLFEKYGAYVHVIHNQPNGININQACGSLHPETLRNAVIKYKAHIGFAFDGDGDRVIAATHDGSLLDGDLILALLLQNKTYTSQRAIVGTSVTNYGLEQFLKRHNKKLFRSAVGDKYVAQMLQKHHLLLGGEQSGHTIMRDYLDSGDGLFTALRICQTALYLNTWSLNLFTPYPQIHINIPIVHKKDLSEEPLASIITTHETYLPAGKLVVRYSGTENILRVMIEAEDSTHAQQVAHSLSYELQKQLAH